MCSSVLCWKNTHSSVKTESKNVLPMRDLGLMEPRFYSYSGSPWQLFGGALSSCGLCRQLEDIERLDFQSPLCLSASVGRHYVLFREPLELQGRCGWPDTFRE